MFERKAYGDILRWSEGLPRTALLVRGARQIGKSTLVRHLGQTRYEVLVEIDLFRDAAAKKALADARDVGELISRISLLSDVPLVPGRDSCFYR